MLTFANFYCFAIVDCNVNVAVEWNKPSAHMIFMHISYLLFAAAVEKLTNGKAKMAIKI